MRSHFGEQSLNMILTNWINPSFPIGHRIGMIVNNLNLNRVSFQLTQDLANMIPQIMFTNSSLVYKPIDTGPQLLNLLN